MLTADELWSRIQNIHKNQEQINSLSEREFHTIGSIDNINREYEVHYSGDSARAAKVDFNKIIKIYSMVHDYGSLTNQDMEEFGHAEISMSAWNIPGSAMLAVIPYLDENISVSKYGNKVGLAAPIIERYGLLVRMNPNMYTNWSEEIPANGSEVEIKWRCNLKPGTIPLHTPVYVLGTGGIGFIAEGSIISDVFDSEGTPESWSDADKDKGGMNPRVALRLSRNMKSEGFLRNSSVDYLINRQGTFSWLNEDETFILEEMLD